MKKSYVLLAVLMMCTASSFAALTMVDDFEGLNLGTINGQGNWAANRNSSAIGDSGWSNVVVEDGDKCLKLTNRDLDGEIDTVYTTLNLASQTITGEGTLYLRYKADSANDCIMGLNDLLPGFASAGATAMETGYQGATTYSGQGPLVRLGSDQNFRARHDTAYLEVDEGLTSDTWYEMWMLVDAANDRCKYYIAADDGLSLPMAVINPNTSDEWWVFRNQSYDQLSSMKWFMGSQATECNVFIDTIAVDTTGYTLDCVADVPEPATMSLLVLGGLGLIRRRR